MSDPNDPDAPGDEPTDEVPATPAEPGPADEPTAAMPVTVPAPPPGQTAPAYAADPNSCGGPACRAVEVAVVLAARHRGHRPLRPRAPGWRRDLPDRQLRRRRHDTRHDDPDVRHVQHVVELDVEQFEHHHHEADDVDQLDVDLHHLDLDHVDVDHQHLHHEHDRGTVTLTDHR